MNKNASRKGNSTQTHSKIWKYILYIITLGGGFYIPRRGGMGGGRLQLYIYVHTGIYVYIHIYTFYIYIYIYPYKYTHIAKSNGLVK